MSAMESLLAMYAANLANSMIRDVFVLLHQQLRLMPGDLEFQNGDEWARTEPRRWVERTRISVTMGPTLGERMRLQAGLRETIAIQRQDKAEDSVLTSSSVEYEARVDFYRALGLKNPEQYAVDPNAPSGQVNPQTGQELTIGQADAQAKAQMAQQQQEMQMRAQQMQYEYMQSIAQMQEMTKRMSDYMDQVEAQRDRLVKWYTTQTRTQADLKRDGIDVDVPGGLLEADEPARLM